MDRKGNTFVHPMATDGSRKPKRSIFTSILKKMGFYRIKKFTPKCK